MYYWALCFHSSDPVRDGKWADTATKEEMFEKAMELTKGLEEFFTRIIEETGVQGMKVPPLRFREFVPTEEFPPQMDGNGKRGGLGRSVTLLGDAAHSSKYSPKPVTGCEQRLCLHFGRPETLIRSAITENLASSSASLSSSLLISQIQVLSTNRI